MNENLLTIDCIFDNTMTLYAAYMPFIKNGGLFVRSKELCVLGDKVNLSIKLLEEPIIYELQGKVIWITALGAQGNKPAGFGVQLIGEDRSAVCNKIETLLADRLKSSQMTDSM